MYVFAVRARNMQEGTRDSKEGLIDFDLTEGRTHPLLADGRSDGPFLPLIRFHRYYVDLLFRDILSTSKDRVAYTTLF